MPQPDDADLQELATRLIRTNPGYAGGQGAIHLKHGWNVESGETADGRVWHRWFCTCGHTGQWRQNPDMASYEGDNHITWGDFG